VDAMFTAYADSSHTHSTHSRTHIHRQAM